jgi:hypothetical protein
LCTNFKALDLTGYVDVTVYNSCPKPTKGFVDWFGGTPLGIVRLTDFLRRFFGKFFTSSIVAID